MVLPGSARRLWALDAPKLTLSISMMMLGSAPAYDVTIPVPSFLIEHPKGLVLFDTGIVPEALEDPEAVYGELAKHMRIEGNASQRLDRQIVELGYKVEDVTHVVLSHSHFDHAGGLLLFPNAKFYVGEGELAFGFWPGPAFARTIHRPGLEAARGFNWYEVPGCDVDLFGDGSIVIMFTPGHTPGELSLLVRLPYRTFVITGDTAHVRAQLDNLTPHPFSTDIGSAIRSLKRLRLLRDTPDTTVWISHDPDDWASYEHAPRCYE
jgi:glyoxylase-like metal-dependent hydrolase (beta-lactamase superfamily II)